MRPPFRSPLLSSARLLALSGIAGLIGATALQADIPSWRTNHNGTYNVPKASTNWESNLLFDIPLETTSNGTPILVDGKLFYTAEPDLLICADSRTGKTLWSHANNLLELSDLGPEQRRSIAAHQERINEQEQNLKRLKADAKRLERTLEKKADNPAGQASLKKKQDEMAALEKEVKKLKNDKTFSKFVKPTAHNTNGYSSYTPVSDGKRVFVTNGLGVVVAYDLKGKRLWSEFIEHPDHGWGGATMPQLIDGKLIVRFDDYWALDPKTGKKLWNTPSEVIFGTPTPFQVEGQTFLFTARGEIIRAKDGKVIHDGFVYLHDSRHWSIFNTPTLVGDILYTVSGVEGDNGDAYAFRIPKDLDTFLKSGLEEVWHTQVEKNRYYASVLALNDLAYIITRDNELTVLEAKSGDIVYTEKISGARGTAYPSMVAADNKIFLGIDDGTLVILEPGRAYKEIARNKFDTFRSTPIFDGNIAYLRTYESLKAIQAR